MRISRREFLKAAAAATIAGRLAPAALAELERVLRRGDEPRVIWLQGSGCDGCAVSLLNSIHYASVDDLLLNTLDVKFQNNLMAAAGDLAVSAAEAAAAEPGYVLVVEGSVPVGAEGRYCLLWPGMSMHEAVQSLSPNAAFIVALGSCAAYGGVCAGAPNPTEARGVGQILGEDPRLINVPGCPAHPDWLVGTIAYLLANGHAPPLDAHRRPLQYFGERIHDNCFKRRKYCGEAVLADQLSDIGCMEFLGCKGKHTYSDCPIRKWNSPGSGQYGVNWCVGARSPCLGCVNPNFPDGMSPFYVHLPEGGGGRGDDGNHPDPATPAPAGTKRDRRPTS
jgi:hydrogenase small subunit